MLQEHHLKHEVTPTFLNVPDQLQSLGFSTSSSLSNLAMKGKDFINSQIVLRGFLFEYSLEELAVPMPTIIG